jgi:hypothetical protein
VTARAEAGVQVDPAQPPAARAVLAQHVTQRLVAPGRRRAAEEQAVGVAVLAARDDLLQALGAMRGGVGGKPLL